MAKQHYKYQDCIVIIPEYAYGYTDSSRSFTIHRDDIIEVKYLIGDCRQFKITGRFDGWSEERNRDNEHCSIRIDMSDKYKTNVETIGIGSILSITKVEE